MFLEIETIDCFIDKILFILEGKKLSDQAIIWNYWELTLDVNEKFIPIKRVGKLLKDLYNINLEIHSNNNLSQIISNTKPGFLLIPGEFNKIIYKKRNQNIEYPHYILLESKMNNYMVYDLFPKFYGELSITQLETFYSGALKYDLPLISVHLSEDKVSNQTLRRNWISQGVNSQKKLAFSSWLTSMDSQELERFIKNIPNNSTIIFRKNALIRFCSTIVHPLSKSLIHSAQENRWNWEIIWKKLLRCSFTSEPLVEFNKIVENIILVERQEQELISQVKNIFYSQTTL
jgi:hypothetical protein